jgi:hypothetical protein
VRFPENRENNREFHKIWPPVHGGFGGVVFIFDMPFPATMTTYD